MKNLLPLALATMLATPFAGIASPGITFSQETPGAFVARLAGADELLSLEEVRKGIAELEPLVIALRDLESADANLRAMHEHFFPVLGASHVGGDTAFPKVWGEVTSKEGDSTVDSDLAEAARLVLLAQVEVKLALGLLPHAQAMLQGSVFDGASRRAVRSYILDDLRIVELTAYVNAKVAGQFALSPKQYMLLPFDSDDAAIDEAVRDALAKGSEPPLDKMVETLGARMAPALAKAVTDNLDFLPSDKPDPLLYLMKVQPAMAASLMKSHLTDGGFLWKRRMVSALFEGAGGWFDFSKHPATCLVPDAIPIMEYLAADPEVATEAFAAMPKFHTGVYTPALTASLLAALNSNDRELSLEAVSKLVTSTPVRASKAPLEEALNSPHADVRSKAAGVLSRFPWSEALASKVTDSDVEVRLVVARTLGSRKELLFSDEWSRGTFGAVLEMNSSGQGALLQLLSDPEIEVRRVAAEALRDWPNEVVSLPLLPTSNGDFNKSKDVVRLVNPPSLDALRQAAQDPDPHVQEYLLRVVGRLDTQTGIALLTILAADQNAEVAKDALGAVPKEWIVSAPEETLRIYQAFLANPKGSWSELLRSSPSGRSSLQHFAITGPGCEALVPWLLSMQGDALDSVLFSRYHWADSENDLRTNLTPETFARLIRSLDDGEHEDRITTLLVGCSEVFADALEGLSQDPNSSVLLRAIAASNLSQFAEQGWQDALRLAMHDSKWDIRNKRGRDANTAAYWIKRRAGDLPDATANAFGLMLVQDEELEGVFFEDVVRKAWRIGEGGVLLAEAIKKRWGGAEQLQEFHSPLDEVIDGMPSGPAYRDDTLLEAALFQFHYSQSATFAIGNLRDPALLPMLARFIRESDPRYPAWRFAVTKILPSLLSDESAGLLLEAVALTSESTTREQCLASLESMRTYFLARDYWARRQSLAASKDEAIAELLGMLDDESAVVRTQAVRGLGTFDAVGAIPKLIGMLKDASPDVVKAATDALEKLNRTDELPADGE